MPKLALLAFAALTLGSCATQTDVFEGPFLDPANLIVGAGRWRIDLVKDCGLTPNPKSRDLEALSFFKGAKYVFVLNSIPIVDLESRTGRVICRETISAFGPAA